MPVELSEIDSEPHVASPRHVMRALEPYAKQFDLSLQQVRKLISAHWFFLKQIVVSLGFNLKEPGIDRMQLRHSLI